MRIERGKIVSGTETELYEYWLKRYDDIFSWPEYLQRMKELGVKVSKDDGEGLLETVPKTDQENRDSGSGA